MDLNSHTIDIPCPHCGKKFPETIGRLKQNPKLPCPHCGAVIAVKADQLRDGLKAVDKSLDKLRATLGKFGKR